MAIDEGHLVAEKDVTVGYNIRANLLFAGLYFVFAVITQSVFQTIAVWPSIGVSFAGLLIFGAALWPSVALGTFLGVMQYFLEIGEPLSSVSVWTICLATVVGNTSGVVAAYYVSMHGVQREHLFDSFGWLLRRFIPACFVLSIIAAILGVGVYFAIGQPWSIGFFRGVVGWTISNVVGAVIFTPALYFLWTKRPRAAERRLDGWNVPQLLLVLAIAFILFSGYFPEEFTRPEYLWLPLIWAVMAGTSFSLAILNLVTFYVIWAGTDMGAGPFVLSDGTVSLVAMQTYLGITFTILLLLRSVLKKQRRDLLRLEKAKEQVRANEATEKANADLERVNEVLTKAQHIAHLGSWTHDLRTNALTWSDEIYLIFGLRPQEFEASYEAFVDAVHPDDREVVKEAVANSLEQHTPYRIDHRVVRSDGTERIVHEEAEVFLDDTGTPVRMIGTVQDTTESKQAEAALKEAKAEAEQANLAKSRFLSSMSHELRTPLNAILGFSKLLSRDPAATPGQHQKLNIINRSGEHLLEVINGVLDLSKIEAGRIELESIPFDLVQVLSDVSVMIHLRAKKKNLSFVLDLADDLQPYVKGDVGKLRQILINLLGNAVKFTEAGGVTMRARTEATTFDEVRLLVDVEDSGPGIANGQLTHLFEPFVQAGSTLDKQKGAGLGLAITKSFVDLMGGAIAVTNRAEGGFGITVELPLAIVADDTVIKREATPAQVVGLVPGRPEWRVLIVEDDDESRLLLLTQLSQVGFTVREAENGEQAVRVFQEWSPHFIWMDMRMPVMGGYKATAQIRSLPGGDKVCIAALTASVFAEQEKEILAVGCDAVVRKPYREEELFDIMSRYMDVEFIYEKRQVPAPMRPVTPDDVAKLPPDLIKGMCEAVLSSHMEKMQDLINRVPEDQADLAASLQHLVHEFEWERLEALFSERNR